MILNYIILYITENEGRKIACQLFIKTKSDKQKTSKMPAPNLHKR